ncbi:MAG: nucleoside deaminase [Candidatus Omnitrophica bacterium]|nr:nucleoside deaminase [Candidatus Omnitrophota bacterium]
MSKRFMEDALRQAERALEADEVPVGCVIVHKNRVIAKAHNQTNLLKDPTAHAEILAITQAAAHLQHERLLDTELYVTIEPCPMCLGAILHARISKVYYGAPNDKYGACGSVVNLLEGRFNHTVEVHRGLLDERAASLLQAFFRSKRARTV